MCERGHKDRLSATRNLSQRKGVGDTVKGQRAGRRERILGSPLSPSPGFRNSQVAGPITTVKVKARSPHPLIGTRNYSRRSRAWSLMHFATHRKYVAGPSGCVEPRKPSRMGRNQYCRHAGIAWDEGFVGLGGEGLQCLKCWISVTSLEFPTSSLPPGFVLYPCQRGG